MTIKDLQLYKENNKYYLQALLDEEDKRGYYQVSIPKIRLLISFDCFVNNETDIYFGVSHRIVSVDLGEWHDDHPLNYMDCPEQNLRNILRRINKE